MIDSNLKNGAVDSDGDYFKALNEWHLKIAMVQSGIQRSVMDLDDDVDEGRMCILNILAERLGMLVRSCPFPSLR